MTTDGNTLDFDPRRWAGAADAPPPAAPRNAMRWPLLAGAASLFVAGPVASLLDRQPPASQPPASPPGAIQPAKRGAAPIAMRPDVVERTTTLPAATDLVALLEAQGLSPDQATAAQALALPHLGGGGAITAVVSLRLGSGDAPDQVLRIRAARADSSGVVLVRDAAAAQGWRAEPLSRSVAAVLTVARGEMNDDSLYSSAVAAGVDESLIPDFAQAFVYDFDFQREIRAGDVFEMAAEQTVNADGQPVGAPTLVYAAFTTADKSRALYRFTPPGAQHGWYDGNGRSIVRSLMRTPVEGARVSSTFGWRVHPVLGFRKLHNGIDFAVPSGTPVYAAGAGVVEAARFSATAGNMVILRHDKGYLTKYFHFTSFAPGVTTGAKVVQGQQIGLSGTTGRSTGPHLHYELHLNGEAIDPASVKTEDGVALAGAALDAFHHERDRIDVARAAHAR